MRVDAAEFVPGAPVGDAVASWGRGAPKGLSADATEFVPSGLAPRQPKAADVDDGEANWPSLSAARQPAPRRSRTGSAASGSTGASPPARPRAPPPPPPSIGALPPAAPEAEAEFELVANAGDYGEGVYADYAEAGRSEAEALAANAGDYGEGVYADYAEVGMDTEAYYYGGQGQGVCYDFPDEETFLTPQLVAYDMTAASSTAEALVHTLAADAALAELQAEGGFAPVTAVAGDFRVERRRLTWTARDPEASAFDAVPQGECVESPSFWIAGAELRLAFYPRGTSLAGEGDCSAALVAADRAKLKFELFLNGKTAGRKVLLGKRFSCDFRRPPGVATVPLSSEAPAPAAEDGASPSPAEAPPPTVASPAPSAEKAAVCVEVGVEVHENLMYAGFF